MASNGATDVIFGNPPEVANQGATTPASCASFQLLLMQFMAQLRDRQISQVLLCEQELKEERDKLDLNRNATLEAEQSIINEMVTLRLQAEELAAEKRQVEQLLNKAVQQVEGRQGEIRRLEQSLAQATQERTELLSQLQSKSISQVQTLIAELRENLTSLQLLPAQARRGYFSNGTLNHYVQKIPGTCDEKVAILNSNLKKIPSLLTGRTVEVALLEATKVNQIPEMEVLISTGISLDKLTADSRTYLWWAAHNGHVGATQVLLTYGARINAISPGWISSTALHVAAWMGQLKVVQVLVENGGDIETKSSESQTVIFYAARRGQVNIVQYLVEKGADLEARDLNGKTAIELATAPVAQWFKERATRHNYSG